MGLDELPKLKHYENSWIAIHKETGKAVREIFDTPRNRKHLKEHFNSEAYYLKPTAEYLSNLNN